MLLPSAARSALYEKYGGRMDKLLLFFDSDHDGEISLDDFLKGEPARTLPLATDERTTPRFATLAFMAGRPQPPPHRTAPPSSSVLPRSCPRARICTLPLPPLPPLSPVDAPRLQV